MVITLTIEKETKPIIINDQYAKAFELGYHFQLSEEMIYSYFKEWYGDDANIIIQNSTNTSIAAFIEKCIQTDYEGIFGKKVWKNVIAGKALHV